MKTGRPRKSETDRRTEVLHVRATKGEADAAYRLARRRRCSLTELFHAYLRRLRDEESPRLFVVQKVALARTGRILRSVAVH